MAYVARDKSGNIISLSYTKADVHSELIDIDAPELVEFLARCDSEQKISLLQSDLQLIRVIEDLVDILLSKNVITITDFPTAVIEKLMLRHNIRKHVINASGMEFGDEL